MKLKFISVVLVFITLFPVVSCGAPRISAHSAAVISSVTGEVVYEKNGYQRLPMASTTKIMTAICALEHGNPDDMVRVHPSAVGVEGSSMYLGHGEVISLRDLTYGLMLASGNDAAVAIAMHISGSIEGFAQLMNETAAKIGVENTSFQNPNGLDAEGHYTTAYDLAMITRYGMSIPAFAEIVATESIKVPWQGRDYPRQLKNHNKLLNMYDGAKGVKTGFTKRSGRCLVSAAERDGCEMIAVTLNAPDDWQDHMTMLDYAFDGYESKELLKADDYLKTVKVTNGAVDRVPVKASSGFSFPVKKGSNTEVRMVYNIPDELTAPVGFGQGIGKVEFYYKEKLIGSVEAVSAGSALYVEPKTLKLYIKKIFKAWIGMNRIPC